MDSDPVFKCICHSDYYGTFCDKSTNRLYISLYKLLNKIAFIFSEVNQCFFRDPCKNGARCKFINETLQCVCAPGFTGQFCEKSN